jgi:putative membrane-bound dehydrogenase-like protein
VTYGSVRAIGRGILLVLGLLAPGLSGPPARAEGLTPGEARARMRLPEGFRVQVFASEPEIRQPVASCFDERGRLWIIEYLQYPVPAGLKPVTVDQYLRTEYDRVPEPPPRGPRGVDRIKILEDTDGDGEADSVKTFVEGLNLASGLAVGHGGVFVAQAPYLLFYPDRDRDDRPDGEPEVLLRGFGLQDAHSTVNSLAWGPDGWLYGAQGSTVTALIRGIGFQQGIWRYHPRTRAFELFAEGGGNTWGLDFDRGGNAFGSSNGGFITFHMVQGGYYWKGFAKHGPLHNPRTYGYFDAIAYDGAKQGGHVTPGGIIYKGDMFPEPFRGAFIGGNLLANNVYWHDLQPRGSTFRGRHAGTLIESRDPWFRPIDLVTGPDGAVYVVDWYDRRASHLDPRDNWDKTNGRIYKVSYGQAPPVPPFDLARLSTAELIDLNAKANDWWPDMARRILAERRDPLAASILGGRIASNRDATTALRDLWALAVSGGLDDAMALSLLDHPLPGVRRWVVRLLGDDHRMSDALRPRLAELAARDPDVAVRSQLASSCQRWRAEDALPILARLMARPEDVDDPHVPLLIWWAFEKQMRADREAAIALIIGPETGREPLVEAHLLDRVARALASGASTPEFEDCARLLAAAPSSAAVDRVVSGMEKGLEGRRIDRVPAPLDAALRTILAAEPDGLGRLRLAVRLGSDAGRDRVIARVLDSRTPPDQRRGLVELLGQVPSAPGREALIALLDRPEAPALQQAAIRALAGHDDPGVAEALLAHYASWDDALRDTLRDVLCTRPGGADRLIRAIEEGAIPAGDLEPAQVLQIVRLGDPSLASRVEKCWGRIPGSGSSEKRQRIAEVRGMMPEGDRGSAARGQALFVQHCGVCHKLFGEGETIGPELTGSERGDLEFLLTSIIDPSALIRKEYEAQTIALTDGRVLSGLVVEDNETSLTLLDSQRQKTVVPKADVEATKPSSTSLMPEGLLDKLPDDQIRDLFRYLQSPGPPVK